MLTCGPGFVSGQAPLLLPILFLLPRHNQRCCPSLPDSRRLRRALTEIEGGGPGGRELGLTAGRRKCTRAEEQGTPMAPQARRSNP
jgi:hypothetical protein